MQCFERMALSTMEYGYELCACSPTVMGGSGVILFGKCGGAHNHTLIQFISEDLLNFL